MRSDKQNIIVDKTIDFSLSIIRYCEVLENQKKYIVSRQLLRSATSIGANVFEAQNAESKADFIHKMKIAAKEASEVLYWLILCERSDGYHFQIKFKDDIDQIIKIISKIISSAKSKIPRVCCEHPFYIFKFSNFQIISF